MAPGGQWPKCPAAYLSSPEVREATGLLSLAEVSPLQHWPSGWAFWAVEYVCTVKAAQLQRLIDGTRERTTHHNHGRSR